MNIGATVLCFLWPFEMFVSTSRHLRPWKKSHQRVYGHWVGAHRVRTDDDCYRYDFFTCTVLSTFHTRTLSIRFFRARRGFANGFAEPTRQFPKSAHDRHRGSSCSTCFIPALQTCAKETFGTTKVRELGRSSISEINDSTDVTESSSI